MRDRLISYMAGFLLLIYLLVYWNHPAVPSAASVGWWQWFDQGFYLSAAKDLALLNFDRAQHFNFPGYPFLGAFFYRLMPLHPFLLVNLLSFLIVFWTFVAFAKDYVSRSLAIGLFLASVLLNPTIFGHYIKPWTTTPVAACFGLMIWIVGKKDRKWLHFLAFSFCAGLIFSLRPGDVVMTFPLYAALFWKEFGLRRRQPISTWIPVFLLLLAGGLIGISISIGLNLRIFGAASGSYLDAVANNGIYFADFPQKFVSIFLDSKPIFGLESGALLRNNPWIIVGFLGIVLAWMRRDMLLICISLSFFIQLFIYLSYSDLLPNGMWRFGNLHYFKWTFPFYALYAALACLELRTKEGRRRLLIPGVVVLLICSLSFRSAEFPFASTRYTIENEQAVFHAKDLGKKTIMAIDFPQGRGEFDDLFFGKHEVEVDGRNVKLVKDARIIPLGKDKGFRLLFIRPVQADSLRFVLAPRTEFGENRIAIGKTFHWTLKGPIWLTGFLGLTK